MSSSFLCGWGATDAHEPRRRSIDLQRRSTSESTHLRRPSVELQRRPSLDRRPVPFHSLQRCSSSGSKGGAPRLWNDAIRCAYLKCLGVMDVPATAALERILASAAQACGCPMAAISLIDSNRCWFKTSLNLQGIAEVPRDRAICSWAVVQERPELLVVPDALEDVRFSRLPAATGPLAVRFYAGCPLVASNGLHLGTLCVMDSQPRQLDAAAAGVLVGLAAMVTRELEGAALLEAAAQEAAGALTTGICGEASCALTGH